VALRPPTEVERQKRVIASLGDDYLYPLFNGRQAIELTCPHSLYQKL
jgi:hypothetical protein